VQTAVDRGRARRPFEQALDETRRFPGRDGAFFLEHARFLRGGHNAGPAAVYSFGHQKPGHFKAENLGRIMIEHGNLEAAMELAMRYDNASAFPFSVAVMLMEA
jgi:hypothetical protein